ncbi:glycosyltransferase [bacterium]|nr:glycosyltransferase [candidate division CSSED10-310 bacterium]
MPQGSTPETMVKYSVVIPVRDHMTGIGVPLRALEDQTIDRALYEVIVVDDGSTDGTGGAADRHGVRVLRQESSGPAAARNLGARAAAGAILLFTDADCRPERDWIERLTAPFVDPDVFGVKGAYLSSQSSLIARFVQQEYEAKYRRMARFSSIDFIDTYSAAFRRDDFLALGGYDESYPGASVEDQEFSFRAAAAGLRMVFEPGALVTHEHAATLFRYARKKFNIGFWKVKLLRRHPGKAVRDSHTPQMLKLQMVLAVIVLAGIAARLAGWGSGLLLAGCGLFLAATIPAALGSFPADPAAALLTPLFLFVRALALTLGLLWGTVSQLRRTPS